MTHDPKMDIFKLFYNHDQRLDQLQKRNANKTPEEVEATLADFMKPDPTFSKFYLTGTRLDLDKFGLNQLDKYEAVIAKMDQAFEDWFIHTTAGRYDKLSNALQEISTGSVIVLSKQRDLSNNIEALHINEESNVGHRKDELRSFLINDHQVIYKEQAKNGFDLHLFSKENIYPQLFHTFQQLVDDSFRFFSINSKRMRSERHFYFETWTLDKPPHGAEEVFDDTVLRSK